MNRHAKWIYEVLRHQPALEPHLGIFDYATHFVHYVTFCHTVNTLDEALTSTEVHAYPNPWLFLMPKTRASTKLSYDACTTGSWRQQEHVFAFGKVDCCPSSSLSCRKAMVGLGLKPSGGICLSPVAKNRTSSKLSVHRPATTKNTYNVCTKVLVWNCHNV